MKKIITYGTFDLFHIGHLNIIKRAKDLGDHLTVVVSSDEFNKIKGKKTVIPFDDRIEIVKAIEYVDEVLREDSWEQKADDIINNDINIFVMGHDWEGKFDALEDHCEVVYLPRTDGISTTILKKISKHYL